MQAIYGLKIIGSAFWNHLADFMNNLGFQPCPYELYIWMKPMVRPDDGFNYYVYVLIYVNDVMFIHHYVESVIRRIDKYFKFKYSYIGDPEIYLGSNLKKIILENRVWAWANISPIYVK